MIYLWHLKPDNKMTEVQEERTVQVSDVSFTASLPSFFVPMLAINRFIYSLMSVTPVPRVY